MNLAPIRYARVMAGERGPVERVEYGPVRVAGRPYMEAVAYLSRHLNLQRPQRQVAGTADGAGADSSGLVARHKAISEALERWAYYFVHQTGREQAYGFREEPYTTGMAAFPGLLGRTARELARREGVERYCLAGWWAGKLGAREADSPVPGCRVLRLENPLSRDAVVILWRQSAQGYFLYGFSAARKLEGACWKAAVEMERCGRALKGLFLANPGMGMEDLPTLGDPLERRLVYFALPEGHEAFRQRRRDGAGRCFSGKAPKPLVDTEIPGPWRTYASVWRVLYPLPGRDHLDPTVNAFYW